MGIDGIIGLTLIFSVLLVGIPLMVYDTAKTTFMPGVSFWEYLWRTVTGKYDTEYFIQRGFELEQKERNKYNSGWLLRDYL